MDIYEIILIGVGLSLEIFSIVICKGAMFSSIKKKSLFELIGVFGSWELVTLLFGNLLVSLLNFSTKEILPKLITIVLFGIIAIRMLVKAWKNEDITESRQDKVKLKNLIGISSITGLNGLAAGIGFGFLGTNLLLEIIIVIVISAIAIVVGIFIGYNYGYRPKTKAYFIGGIVLLITDIDLILRYIS